MACILPFLTEMKVVKSETLSDSLIVFGTLLNNDANVNRIDYTGKVVLKLSPQPQHDNSLEKERDIYMFVKNNLSHFTKHFASGIAIGQCDLEETLQTMSSKEANKLHQVRGQLIVAHFQSDTHFQSRLLQLQHQYQSKPRLSLTLEQFISQQVRDTYDQIPFIITPKLEGITLTELLQRTTEPLSNTFEFEIAVQVAQALYAAELVHFIHNDLHPGNIFVKVYDTTKHIPYHGRQFPIPFTLETRYEITIFDYDLSYYEGMSRNTKLDQSFCPYIGLCNEFTSKFDWETFLRYFITLLEQRGYRSQLRMLLGASPQMDLMHQNSEGEPLAFEARPCVCREWTLNEQKENICARCDRKVSNALVDPRGFLASMLALHPHFLHADAQVSSSVSVGASVRASVPRSAYTSPVATVLSPPRKTRKT